MDEIGTPEFDRNDIIKHTYSNGLSEYTFEYKKDKNGNIINFYGDYRDFSVNYRAKYGKNNNLIFLEKIHN